MGMQTALTVMGVWILQTTLRGLTVLICQVCSLSGHESGKTRMKYQVHSSRSTFRRTKTLKHICFQQFQLEAIMTSCWPQFWFFLFIIWTVYPNFVYPNLDHTLIPPYSCSKELIWIRMIQIWKLHVFLSRIS